MLKNLLKFAWNHAGTASTAALVVGLVAQLLGINLAPEQVNVILTVGASVIALYKTLKSSGVVDAVVAGIKAKFTK